MAKEKDEAVYDDFLNDLAGQGFEDHDQQDFSIPFIKMAQQLSPQLDSEGPDYIPGLSQGDWFNTVTGEVYGRSIEVIPFKFEKVWLEWKPNRGGLVERYAPHTIEVDQSDYGNWKNPANGNDVVEVYSFYVFMADDITAGPAVISLSSTQIRHAKNWNTQIMMTKLDGGGRAPFFAAAWELTTTKVSNDQGSWWALGQKTTNVKRTRFITLEEFNTAVHPAINAFKNKQISYEERAAIEGGSTAEDTTAF